MTRSGEHFDWNDPANPPVEKKGTFAALLAIRGINGPEEVVDGNGDSGVDRQPFRDRLVRRTGALERVRRSIIKRRNAEIYQESARDAARAVRTPARS